MKKKPLPNWLITAFYAIALCAWVAATILISQTISYYLFRFLIRTFHLSANTTLQTIYAAFIYVLALAILLGTPKILEKLHKKHPKIHPVFGKNTRELLGLGGLPTWTDILLSPIGFIVQLLLSAVLVGAFSIFPWFNASEAQDTGYSDLFTAPDKLLAFLALAVIAPIAEELIFRGYLYGKLRARLNLPVSLLITSLLFAVMHGQWNVGVNVFATSVVLCLLREITGTIYSGILVHAIKNGVAFYILYILGTA